MLVSVALLAFAQRFGCPRPLQARQAVFHYRQQHGITTPIVCAGPTSGPPFHVAHLLSYWKKDATTG